MLNRINVNPIGKGRVVVVLVAQLCPTLCDSMDCSLPGFSVHGNFPGKNTGVGNDSLLQGIFLFQRSNPGLLHWKADSLPSEPPDPRAVQGGKV